MECGAKGRIRRYRQQKTSLSVLGKRLGVCDAETKVPKHIWLKMNQLNLSLALVDKLKAASDNLLFMSEADYPFEVILWEVQEQELLTKETVLQLAAQAPDTPVEVVPLDDFFQNATQEQDWYEPEEKETAQRYRQLVETLKTNLSDIQVYRLGTTEIDVYILGKTPEPTVVGLQTKVVET